MCCVCVCLQVDCQLIDTAPERDDDDMGRGVAMDSMVDKEGIAGAVVPCCPICGVVDGALAARNPFSLTTSACTHGCQWKVNDVQMPILVN